MADNWVDFTEIKLNGITFEGSDDSFDKKFEDMKSLDDALDEWFKKDHRKTEPSKKEKKMSALPVPKSW